MDDGILRRVSRRTGVDDLASLLAERLSSGDLQSLLLEVYARRASRLDPDRLLERQRSSRFCQPAAVTPRQLAELERLWLEHLPAPFEPVVLSPLAPLGSCSVLAPVHQNKVLATTRNLEVAADPSNQLALECALRRQRGAESVHLSACQRVVRAQALPGPHCFAHFSLLALASAGRAPDFCPASALAEQLGFHLRYLRAALPDEALLLAWSGRTPAAWVRQVESRLRNQGLTFQSSSLEDSVDSNYYPGARFKLWAGEAEVGDGGVTDWAGRLLRNRRERLVISGLGLDRLGLMRQKKETPAAGGVNRGSLELSVGELGPLEQP